MKTRKEQEGGCLNGVNFLKIPYALLGIRPHPYRTNWPFPNMRYPLYAVH